MAAASPEASPYQRLKAGQLQALEMMLPESAEVAEMLRAWRAADTRYWAGQLRPCWLTAGIETYGKCLGSWSPGTRTMNRAPTIRAATRYVADVVIHACCHQAQTSASSRSVFSRRGSRP